MCGICCICSLTPKASCDLTSIDNVKARSFLENRGPDTSGDITCFLWDHVTSIFAGFVLHLRGTLTPQPLANEEGDILLWNGEIFDGIEIGETNNDTRVLFNKLVKCTSDREITAILQAIQGPWSIIFWQARERHLWFGRDVFGRRSLLWHLPGSSDDTFALSSVAIRPLEYEEVPSVGIFRLTRRLLVSNSDGGLHRLQLHLFPWQRVVWPGTDSTVATDTMQSVLQHLNLENSQHIDVVLHNENSIPSWMPALNKIIPDPHTLREIPGHLMDASDPIYILQKLKEDRELTIVVDQLVSVLEKSVMKRVYNLPRHGTHVEGTVLDYGAAAVHQKHTVHASGNVFLDGLRDVEVSDSSALSLTASGNARSRSTENGSVVSCCAHESCATDQDWSEMGNQVLTAAQMMGEQIRRRVQIPEAAWLVDTVPSGVSGDMSTNCESQSAHIAILFSGGVDSAVLAAMADRCLPEHEPIDLINVAFQQKENRSQRGKRQAACVETGSSFNVPDRQTGYKALSELNLCRQWNFVEVNVTQEMLQQQRSEHIRHLLYPQNTVLDDSIGCAVWFAARGQGILGNGPHKGQPYVSKARVILCGMGADEQLAGYSRHRVRFKQDSWSGLNAELEMEINRISTRNLGRDDRIITDHGKESRFPFLDEQLVAFLASLPVHYKADLRLPQGVGEKLLLRLAACQLGLKNTAALPKRAIQFGSRIAKMEESREKGSQVCRRLVSDPNDNG